MPEQPGRRRLIRRLLPAFAVGALSGLAVFYWWAEWGKDVGTYAVNVAAVAYTVICLVLAAILTIGYRYLTKDTKKRRLSRHTLQGYCAGWLLVFPLGLLLFPADKRHFPPPPRVQAMAEALQQQLAATHAPWEANIPAPRTNTTFTLLPAPKAVGLMPARPWLAQWRSQYSNGSSTELDYFLNGLAPPRLVSAQFIYAQQVLESEDPQALSDRIVTRPATAPWRWALANPDQSPTNIAAKTVGNNGIQIQADYPGGITIRWSRTRTLGDTVEHLSYHAPTMPLPCREPWQRMHICVPLR